MKNKVYGLKEFAVLRFNEKVSVTRHIVIESFIIVLRAITDELALCNYLTFLNIMVMLANLLIQMIKMIEFYNIKVLVSNEEEYNSSYSVKLRYKKNSSVNVYIKERDYRLFTNLNSRDRDRLLYILEDIENE